MREIPLILAVDDTPENLEILEMRLGAQGYEVVTAADGEQALLVAHDRNPDLVLLDVMMPKLDGIGVVRQLKADPRTRPIPVILVTAKSDIKDVVQGLDAGADDYLTKPFDHAALLARVRSGLRQKALHDTVQDQAAKLEEQARTLAEWNTVLEKRVAEQVDQLERVGRLRRFLPNQVVDLIVASGGSDDVLASQRREVTVVFCDLRGFTAFAESTDPEHVMAVLHDYHACVGPLIRTHEGTLERFLGDGLLVLFNAPLPHDDHVGRAVRMSLEAKSSLSELVSSWTASGYRLGFGIGIAQGEATLGRIGFEDRLDYAAIGRTPNLAARLCGEAKSGQILVSERVARSVDGDVEVASVGALSLKGFAAAVPTFEILGEKTADASLL